MVHAGEALVLFHWKISAKNRLFKKKAKADPWHGFDGQYAEANFVFQVSHCFLQVTSQGQEYFQWKFDQK